MAAGVGLMGKVHFFDCCRDCKARTPACSDQCIDYLMAKAMRRAEKQWMREKIQKIGRDTNGRK